MSDETNQAQVVVLRDAEGHYYLLPGDLLAQHRATDAEQVVLDKCLTGEVQGYGGLFTGMTFGLSGSLASGAELSMIDLQNMLSQRQLAVQMTTSLLSTMDESSRQIAKNIGR